MLNYDAFYLGTSISFYHLHSFIPAGGQAGIVGPYHMYLHPTFFFGQRIGVFNKLIFHWSHVFAGAPECDRRIKDSLFEKSLGKKLLLADPGAMAPGLK